mmetsp:Transcript_5551/g.13813  ORF Transcript_5551/g.13813 Transcript_5551/m.13813 type:complete len:313 (-) Transcript_5551:1183-2121(-)
MNHTAQCLQTPPPLYCLLMSTWRARPVITSCSCAATFITRSSSRLAPTRCARTTRFWPARYTAAQYARCGSLCVPASCAASAASSASSGPVPCFSSSICTNATSSSLRYVDTEAMRRPACCAATASSASLMAPLRLAAVAGDDLSAATSAATLAASASTSISAPLTGAAGSVAAAGGDWPSARPSARARAAPLMPARRACTSAGASTNTSKDSSASSGTGATASDALGGDDAPPLALLPLPAAPATSDPLRKNCGRMPSDCSSSMRAAMSSSHCPAGGTGAAIITVSSAPRAAPGSTKPCSMSSSSLGLASL